MKHTPKLIRDHKLNALGTANQGIKKMKYWSDLLSFFSEYVEVHKDDYPELNENPRALLIKKLRLKAGDLMSHFNDSRLLDFYCVPESILNELCNRWNDLRSIPMSEDFSQAIIPTTELYTRNAEENERLSELQDLIKAVQKIADRRYHIDYYALSRALSGVVVASGKRIDPSERYVYGKR
jgi:hypothetical protein